MLKNFVSNRDVNLINLHGSIRVFADEMSYVFMGVYLYKLGIPLWLIFLAWAMNFVLRFLFRPLSLSMCFKLGLKKMLILGSVFYSLMYPVLSQVEGIGWALFIFIVVVSIADVLYWLPFHTFFAIHGDNYDRGKQIGVRFVLEKSAAVMAPISAAFLVAFFDFSSVFWLSGLIILLSIFPILFNNRVILGEDIDWKKSLSSVDKRGMWIYFGDGFFFIQDLAWKLLLFIVVADTISFGGLLSLAVLFQIVLSLVVGHFFDDGRGRLLLKWSMVFLVIAGFGRSVISSVGEVILFDFIFMLGGVLYGTVLGATFYNISKQSGHPLWFQFYAEAGWDFGSCLSALFAAAVLYFFPDFGLRFVVLITLLGLIVSYTVLNNFVSKSLKK